MPRWSRVEQVSPNRSLHLTGRVIRFSLLTGCPLCFLGCGHGVVAVWPHYRWVAVAQVPYFVWVSLATTIQLSITALNR